MLSVEDDPRVHCSRLPGANIMDVTPDNINDYCCGTMLLVSRDVEAILPEGRAREVLAALIEARVPQAFEQRFELVCFKKVAYYLHLQAGSLERQLAQLATFWHGEHEQEPGTDHWQHSARLTELSDARSQCAGACAATSDARAVGKHICSLSRHPSKPTSSFLQELPHSLHTWRLITRAAAAAVAPPPHAKPLCGEAAAAEAEAEAEWQRRLHATLEVQPWPANVRTVVAASVLCRGADKAVRMRDELARARRALDASVAAAEAALIALGLLPTPAQAAQSLAQGTDGGAGGEGGEGGEDEEGGEGGEVGEDGKDGEDGAAESEAKVERGSGDGDAECRGAVNGGGGGDGGGGGGCGGGGGGGGGGDGGGGGRGGRPPLTPAKAALAAAIRRHRHANLLRGALPVLSTVAAWLRAIEASGSNELVPSGARRQDRRAPRLFVAGDVRLHEPRGAPPALVAPRGGSSGGGSGVGVGGVGGGDGGGGGGGGGEGGTGLELFAALRAVEERYRPQLRAAVAASGWPSHIAARRGATRDKAADNKQCRGCSGQFSALWVHRGVCCECEAALRGARRCPFNPACGDSWWCEHAQRCFVCDAHSCAACRMERGAAEAVAAVAARLAPARIAIDFDRTLATTRSGGAPVFGAHALRRCTARCTARCNAPRSQAPCNAPRSQAT